MGAFANPAGIGIMNELAVKKRIKLTVNGMMNKPVTDAGFVNITRLWITDVKSIVTAVPVR